MPLSHLHKDMLIFRNIDWEPILPVPLTRLAVASEFYDHDHSKPRNGRQKGVLATRDAYICGRRKTTKFEPHPIA